MPSIVTAPGIFGDMFGTREMRALFGDRALVQRYLDVEAALARAQARLGIIPQEAARAISDAARVEEVDFQRLTERTLVVGYPILPLVEQLSEWTPAGLGQWSHWGATTQDIMDTADVLQMRDALTLIEGELEALGVALAALVEVQIDRLTANNLWNQTHVRVEKA